MPSSGNAPLTPKQSEFLSARDANPRATSRELCEIADITLSEFSKWSVPGPANRSFQEEMRARDNARHDGRKSAAPVKSMPAVVYVSKPVPAANPVPAQDKLNMAEPVAAPVLETAQVAFALHHSGNGKGPRDSLARVLGPYLTYEKYSDAFMRALQENSGSFANARDVTKTPDDVFNGWLHVPEINAKINEAAAAVGSNETLRTFQAQLNAEYIEKRAQKKGQSANPGR